MDDDKFHLTRADDMTKGLSNMSMEEFRLLIGADKDTGFWDTDTGDLYDDIENLARNIGIEDDMGPVYDLSEYAEAMGMDDYDPKDGHSNEELKNKMLEKFEELKDNEENNNTESKDEDSKNDDEDDVRNGKYNKANSGREAFEKGSKEKNYYNNLKKDAQDRIEETKDKLKDANKNNEKCAERLRQAKENNKNSSRNESNQNEDEQNDKNNLKEAKKEAKKARKNLKEEKEKLKQDEKNLKNIKRDHLKAKLFAATHPREALIIMSSAFIKKMKMRLALFLVLLALGPLLILFVAELILGPLMEVWGNIDEAITGVANFSEKLSNFYNGFGFQDSKEAFYDEIDDLCDRYGCDNNNNGEGINVPLLLSTLFYTEGAGYDTKYQNIEDESAVDNSMNSQSSNSGYFQGAKEWMRDKFDEAQQTVDSDGLVYNTGKIYRLRKLARNQFSTDFFGNATRSGTPITVSLLDFIKNNAKLIASDASDVLTDILGASWGVITAPFKELTALLLGSEYSGSFFENEGLVAEDFVSSLASLVGDLFYGIYDIVSVDRSGLKITVTYYDTYVFDEDNYKNYLMNYYFMNMPEFHSYIGGLTGDALEQKKEMLYKDIVANENLFRDIFLRNTESASEEYSETCTGAIDSALVSELGKPVNIADGVTVNFDTNYSFGIVNGKNHNGVDLNETTAGVKAGDSVYSVAKGKVESITDAKCGENTCGKSVKISHDVTINEKEYKFITIYSNVKPISTLKEGLTVNKGDAIASIDSSENNTEGLHFTFMDALQDSNGTAIDPTNLFIPCGALSGSIKNVGPEAEQEIWNYLLSLGYTKAGVAGMMGNFFQESRYYPDIVNGDYGHTNTEYAKKVASGEVSKDDFTGKNGNKAPGDGGFGIAGFTYWTLKEALYDFKGKEYVADLETQLLFVDAVLKDPKGHGIYPEDDHKELYQTLTTKDTTVEKAAQDFLVIFEFGGKTNCKNLPIECNKEKTTRAGFAQDIYNKYAK